MFGIAAFDFVKIDVEGAEGVIFGSSLEWVGRVSAVMMEVHDFFAGYFGLAVRWLPWRWLLWGRGECSSGGGLDVGCSARRP